MKQEISNIGSICFAYKYIKDNIEPVKQANYRYNLSKSLYKYIQSLSPDSKLTLIDDRLISDESILFLVNGSADVNLSHNSHLRCLASYALQFKFLGIKSHLIMLNMPSHANCERWNNVGKLQYTQYIKNYFDTTFIFNPFDSIQVVLDSSLANLSINEVLPNLKGQIIELANKSRAVFGMSGGGSLMLGSHGLEWAESLHKEASTITKLTLMCHMYDNLSFTNNHTLLSMNKNMTEYNISKENKNKLRIEQSVMLNPKPFMKSEPESINYTAEEKAFIQKIKLQASDHPSLLIAGPWLEKKMFSGAYNSCLKSRITFNDSIVPILREYPDINVYLIGIGNSKIVHNLTDSFSKASFTFLPDTPNFSSIIQSIAELNKNILATFPPNNGNGSTNSEVAASGIATVFIEPNDSQAMLPKNIFSPSSKEYVANLIKMLGSSSARYEHISRTKELFKRHSTHSIIHALEILG